MSIRLALHLDQRLADRLCVGVSVAPNGHPERVEEVSVGLVTADGEPLSDTVILPIVGVLRGPLVSRLQLPSPHPLPRGAAVLGRVLSGECTVEARCPVERGTDLEAFLRGPVPEHNVTRARSAAPLPMGAQHALLRAFPWMSRCLKPEATAVVEEIAMRSPCDEVVEAMAKEHGLDAECAEWLRALLREDEV